MKRRLAAMTVFAVALGGPSAMACRYNMPIRDRIATSEADTVVLAVVRSAAYGKPWSSGEVPWSGVADSPRALKGRSVANSFELGRSGASSMCDDGVPAPKPGDLWVIYLKNGARTLADYPLAVAREADPSLEAWLPADVAR